MKSKIEFALMDLNRGRIRGWAVYVNDRYMGIAWKTSKGWMARTWFTKPRGPYSTRKQAAEAIVNHKGARK